jgi:hypothetical protein
MTKGQAAIRNLFSDQGRRGQPAVDVRLLPDYLAPIAAKPTVAAR